MLIFEITTAISGQDNPHLQQILKGYLRGLDRSWFNDHLDAVFGAGQQLNGPGLSEPGAVRFEVHRAFVGEHF